LKCSLLEALAIKTIKKNILSIKGIKALFDHFNEIMLVSYC